MIMDGLILIASELNLYIQQRINPEQENHVFLSDISDGNGNNISLSDVITITLTNIEEERVNKAQLPNKVRHDTTYTYSEPEIRLNLFIIVSVRPSKNSEGSNSYINALARLSMVSYFFQSHRYFDQSTIQNPSVSNNLRRVIVDLHTVGFEQQSYMWGIHGGHYLPSLMYKLSLIAIHEDATSMEVPVVETIEANIDGGGL